jgi:hypothetical protein
MVLKKLICINRMFTCIIGGLIAEYDIAHAGATAILELKGIDIYEYLMKLDKKTRNIKIGLMMREEKGLSDKVNELMLKYLNIFIKENKIKPQNIIHTTRDSIFVYNKIPIKTIFDHVEFVNKDGAYSSMFRINNYTFLFDSMSGKITVKGIKDEIVEKSPFLHNFLINFLYIIESCQKNGDQKIFNILKYMRNKYLQNNNNNIYKDLLNENKLGIRFNGELIYLDSNIEHDIEEDDFFVAKDLNYINFLMPIMRSVMLNG